MDSVTKFVGGRYIDMFSKHIRSIFSPAFRESPKSVQKKLLTLLKTWYIYYPQEVLNTIYNELGLSTYEVELLTPEDHQKIKKFIDGVKKEQGKNMMNAVPPNQVPLSHPNMPMPNPNPKSTQRMNFRTYDLCH